MDLQSINVIANTLIHTIIRETALVFYSFRCDVLTARHQFRTVALLASRTHLTGLSHGAIYITSK